MASWGIDSLKVDGCNQELKEAEEEARKAKRAGQKPVQPQLQRLHTSLTAH